MDVEPIRRAVTVRGQVQGVSFRWCAREEAERLGVAGWIRNQADGTVRLEVEGPPPAVDALVEWVRHGPPAARVVAVEVEDRPPSDRAGGFTILG